MSINDKEQFLTCLDKTVVWCNGKDNVTEPRVCLRSISMNSIFEKYNEDINAASLSSELISEVLKKREIMSSSPIKKTSSGRVLLVSYEDTNFNGLTEYETNGYFDERDNPPWDTWVCEIEIKYEVKPVKSSFIKKLFLPKSLSNIYDQEERAHRLLVAWVPDCFIETVENAIAVECCNMLFWADREYPELSYKERILKWFQELYQPAHNKFKNENASGAGTDARKDARPF